MKGRKSFSKTVIRAVFKQEGLVEDLNPSVWRQDERGMTICFPAYGDENSSYGWNIHHIDGNKNNNNINNLIAVHYDTHDDLHR